MEPRPGCLISFLDAKREPLQVGSGLEPAALERLSVGDDHWVRLAFVGSSQSIVIPGFFNATEQKHFNKVKYFWPEVIYVFLRLSSFVFFKISNFAKREKRKNLMCFFRQNMLAVKAEEMLHSVNALWLTFLCPQKCIKISHSFFSFIYCCIVSMVIF